jgi:hypothetical protein
MRLGPDLYRFRKRTGAQKQILEFCRVHGFPQGRTNLSGLAFDLEQVRNLGQFVGRLEHMPNAEFRKLLDVSGS